MEANKLKEVVEAILSRTQPPSDILQNLSKSEIEQVEQCLIDVGYKLVKAQIPKPGHYSVPGVKSTGHVPDGHPERQLVINHINKLNNLPEDHPQKQTAKNVANALYQRHLAGDRVIHDTAPKSALPVAPSTPPPTDQPAAPSASTVGSVDMEQYNRQEKAKRAMGVFNYKPQQ